MSKEREKQLSRTNPTRLQQMRESQSNERDHITCRAASSESQNLRSYGSTNNAESNGSVQNSTRSFFGPELQQGENDQSNTCPVQVSSNADVATDGSAGSVLSRENSTHLIPPRDMCHIPNEPVMKDVMRFILLLLFLLFSCLVVCTCMSRLYVSRLSETHLRHTFYKPPNFYVLTF